MSARRLHPARQSVTEEFARAELGQAVADDNTVNDDYGDGNSGNYNMDMNMNNNAPPGGDPVSSFAAMSASAGEGTTSTTTDNDPARLFGILEEGLRLMPKQEGGTTYNNAELQKRRDLAEHTWEFVRRWMWANPLPEQRQAAAFIRGQYDATPLHLMCKLPNPPPDVIAALVDAAPEIASWTDSHGWLPLHHACTNGASPEVMQILIDAFPAGKLQQDNQMRTPLHFYSTRNFNNSAAMAQNAELLADTGAASLCDRGGMYPIHYACAYGTDPAVLEVLTRVHPESLTAKENKGRTPMHLAMVNAHRDSISTVLRFLLDHPASRETVNTRDQDGYLPLHLLALGLRGYKADDPVKRANVADSLAMYLEAKPNAAADFLTAIQDLPDWLQDRAVVSQHVRNVLNDKIVRPLPSAILMLDGYVLVMIIICFGVATSNHIDLRFDEENSTNNTQVPVVFLFFGGAYFLLRELIQMFSLIQLGSFSSWWLDAQNWLDVVVITLVLYFATLMLDSDFGYDKKMFRSGVAFTQGVLYLDVIVYLQSTYVDFAVFVGGVLHVVQRLSAFLTAVAVILLAFAQMFFFIYKRTELCSDEYENEFGCKFPHCSFEGSLLKVYTMMMGEIGDEKRYSEGTTSLVAQILYVAYAFLVVILLSNVLIAIVTDSYEYIQNDKAAIVFWSNRLDFVAEMDAIIYGAQRRLGCYKEKSAGAPTQVQETANGPGIASNEFEDTSDSTEYFRMAWSQIMVLFDANLYDDIDILESWVYNLFRIISIFFIIPLWIVAGLLTAGLLWPPQIRESLFVQKEVFASRAEIERKKLEQLKEVQSEMKNLKQDIMREIANDRDDVIRMKSDIETVQGEVLADLQQIKDLLASLLEA